MHAKCLGEALSWRNLNEVCFQEEEESASRENPGWRVEVVEDDQARWIPVGVRRPGCVTISGASEEKPVIIGPEPLRTFWFDRCW